MGETPVTEELWECPGEAHELDNTFNPGTQDVYGPGYFDCYVCENNCYVTYDVYIEEVEYQRDMKEKMEQARLVEKIMSFPKSDVPT
jgi:hypothetical protein